MNTTSDGSGEQGKNDNADDSVIVNVEVQSFCLSLQPMLYSRYSRQDRLMPLPHSIPLLHPHQIYPVACQAKVLMPSKNSSWVIRNANVIREKHRHVLTFSPLSIVRLLPFLSLSADIHWLITSSKETVREENGRKVNAQMMCDRWAYESISGTLQIPSTLLVAFIESCTAEAEPRARGEFTQNSTSAEQEHVPHIHSRSHVNLLFWRHCGHPSSMSMCSVG